MGWKKGGFAFRVGTTSEVLKRLGVDDRKIYWHATKIESIMFEHPEMTKEVIKQVPQILEKPVVVMESLTVDGRLTMLGDVYGEDGRPVMAVLELNPTSADGKTFIDSLTIVNAYTRGDGIVADVKKRNARTQGILERSNILYIDPDIKRTRNWLTVNRLQLPLPSTSYGFLGSIKPQKLQKVKGQDVKNSLRMAEYTGGPNGEVLKDGRVQVARISTFAAENNREIVRRLQAQSDFFKGMTVADALAQFRYAEQNGLVERGDDWLAVYHDANLEEGEGRRESLDEQMDKVRHSLGLEAQNSRLTQKIEDYQQIVRQQDAEIRELQHELSRAGVRIFADGAKVAKTAGRLLQGYGAEGIRGTERRAINDALAGLYNQMANEQLTKDALETEAGEIAEKILKQSKYMTPAVSDYSRAVLDDIKSVGIVLSDAQKEEMAYRYGSYGAFYRQTFGKLKIRNDGVTLDQRWKELSETDAAIEKNRPSGRLFSFHLEDLLHRAVQRGVV